MESKNEIVAEISAMIAGKITANVAVNCAWLTTEYLNTKSDISGSDLPFYSTCAHHYVWDVAKRCVKRYDDQASSESQQLVMDGFEHLRKAYPVNRGGEICLVPVNQCTDDELRQRAEEYLSMSQALVKHAKEIFAYLEMRGHRVAV
jgi:hypothetical protein